MICVGLLVNPVAGIGGAVALKGSDGADVQRVAAARGGEPRGEARARRALRAAGPATAQLRWLTWDGGMGADLLRSEAVICEVLGAPGDPPGPSDTRQAATAFAEAGADLLVFAGGDGTARDILDAVGERLPVLGIPAGVKMHSGVFAITPEAAGEILVRLVEGGLVRSCRADVRDLDETALRDGVVRPRYFGELLVPELGRFLQRTKESGRENEAMALGEIVADVVERVRASDSSMSFVLGPGSTVAAIKDELGMKATLLGVDVYRDGAQIGEDVDAAWLEQRLQSPFSLVVSFTRGQGFLLGRGNQQLSPAFLARLDRGNLIVPATRSKLVSLDGRPLLIDTDDAELDRTFAGLVEITSGYEDRLLYRVESRAVV
ncbi:MAG TPA: ATP-NAD kinase family protein [Pseudomonadales bacterium]|jgi:predicted polyphosphate/ATP-dependent NAD kinase